MNPSRVTQIRFLHCVIILQPDCHSYHILSLDPVLSQVSLVHMSTPYFFKSLRTPLWDTDVFAGKRLSGVRNAKRNCRIMFHSHGKDSQVWKATVCNSWFGQAKRLWPYSRKSTSFAMEKLNIGLGNVSDIIAGFGCIKVCVLNWKSRTVYTLFIGTYVQSLLNDCIPFFCILLFS